MPIHQERVRLTKDALLFYLRQFTSPDGSLKAPHSCVYLKAGNADGLMRQEFNLHSMKLRVKIWQKDAATLHHIYVCPGFEVYH